MNARPAHFDSATCSKHIAVQLIAARDYWLCRGYEHFRKRTWQNYIPQGRGRTVLFFLGGAGAVTYYTHLEEVPYTHRKHLVLISPATEKALGEANFKQVRAASRNTHNACRLGCAALPSASLACVVLACSAVGGLGRLTVLSQPKNTYPLSLHPLGCAPPVSKSQAIRASASSSVVRPSIQQRWRCMHLCIQVTGTHRWGEAQLTCCVYHFQVLLCCADQEAGGGLRHALSREPPGHAAGPADWQPHCGDCLAAAARRGLLRPHEGPFPSILWRASCFLFLGDELRIACVLLSSSSHEYSAA